ncbi:unnamed protein product, partial [Mesorhabditis spiculigera]
MLEPLAFCYRRAVDAGVIWLNGTKFFPIYGKLWHNAQLRYAADGGTNFVYDNLKQQNLTVPPDRIVGDMDSIRPELYEALKASIPIEKIEEQETTDMTKTFRALIRDAKKNKKPINIVYALGGLAGRFDHVMAALNTLVTESTDDVLRCIIHDTNVVLALKKGIHDIDLGEKYETYTAGKCGLIPICQEETIVTSSGFKWNLVNDVLKFGGMVSTSNEIVARFLQIETSAPLIFTLELKKEFVENDGD